MEIVLLSYSDVLTPNLESFRESAKRLGVSLLEIAPHELSLVVGVEKSTVLFNGKLFIPAVVLHRTVAKFTPLIKPILQVWERAGAVVLNNPEASLASRSKLESSLIFQLEKLPFLQSQFFYGNYGIEPDEPGEVIIKPVFGAQGRDIHFFKDAAQVKEHFENEEIEEAKLIAEPFLSQIDLGPYVIDYRASVVGGKCVALMTRIPEVGTRVANIAQGGTGSAVSLNHPAARLAERALNAFGLEYAGVDILGLGDELYVSEVDAWAGFAGIEKVTGASVSTAILQLALDKAK
jgi:glutathione synthase/RimK-type ligase-like ATP-grasp enzyme